MLRREISGERTPLRAGDRALAIANFLLMASLSAIHSRTLLSLSWASDAFRRGRRNVHARRVRSPDEALQYATTADLVQTRTSWPHNESRT